MANSLLLPNHSLIAPPHRHISVAAVSYKPQPPLPCLPNPRRRLGFSIISQNSNFSSSRSRRRTSSFISHLAPPDSVHPTNAQEDRSQNSEGGSESRPGQPNSPPLRTLLQIYKEAIFDGDAKTVSAVEAKIEVIENERNELVKRLSSSSAEISSGKDKLLRLQADFDNCRKRFEKERLTVRTDAQGEVIESLLPMIDNFERAKQHIKPETEKEKKIDASYQGIYKQFVETLRSLNVAVVPTVGKPFDPSLHEAVAREASKEFKEGIVIQEVRRGFSLGGRLLRPATVTVSSGPGSKKASVATDKSSGLPATAAGVEK